MTKQTYNYGIHVHCTVSNDPSITTTDWFFANGSKVGLVDSNFREGHYNNKTTVLQIGVGRLLTYCDGGNYTCVVNTTSGRTERRSFHLLIRSMLILKFNVSFYDNWNHMNAHLLSTNVANYNCEYARIGKLIATNNE